MSSRQQNIARTLRGIEDDIRRIREQVPESDDTTRTALQAAASAVHTASVTIEADDPTDRSCQAKQYGKTRECEGPPRFDVVYRSPDRTKEYDRHSTCFRHGLAEVERHDASNGIAACDLEEHREPARA